MKTSTHQITISLVFTMLLLPAVAAEKEHSKHSPSPMAAAIADKTGAEFEAAYLGMMILHHQGGMPMWAMVREKSTNEELKAMEQKTTPKEQQEIKQMTAWLKEWHGKTPQDFAEPEASKAMMKKDMDELNAATGKEFDALFAAKMAHHHMGAIEMAKLGTEKAQHDEVKKSAQEITVAQTKDHKILMNIAKENK
ncbi:MAG: DUF305 domain-containing protein [Prosthecobacter sp.]